MFKLSRKKENYWTVGYEPMTDAAIFDTVVRLRNLLKNWGVPQSVIMKMSNDELMEAANNTPFLAANDQKRLAQQLKTE